MAGGAFGVAAVFGEQHANVHFVGFALQIIEEAANAVPLALPVAGPAGRAFEHPVALLVGEAGPGGVARNAGGFGVAHEVVLALLVGGRLYGLDGPSAQGEFVVGDDEAPIDADDTAKAAAGVARAHGRVEREHGRQRRGVAQAAFGAVQAR